MNGRRDSGNGSIMVYPREHPGGLRMSDTISKIYLESTVSVDGESYLKYDSCFEHTAADELKVVIRKEKSASGDASEREFTVFYQTAGAYGKYSQYMKQHGCACCSLTTVLTGYVEKYRNLRPERTASVIEREHFGSAARLSNYKRPMVIQMAPERSVRM